MREHKNSYFRRTAL